MTSKTVRHQNILAALKSTGKVDVTALSAALGVAEMTIRRDLDFFSAEGVLKRVRGGGVAMGSSFEPPFTVRLAESAAEKAAIAREVSEHVNDGATIVLDGGTTGLILAERLFARTLTVIPLSLRVASYLATSTTIQLYIPGGTVRQGDQSLIGPDTLEYLHSHRFDSFIMTASGMAVDGGFSDWNPEEAAVKKQAIRSSNEVLAAVDSSKWGQKAFASICPVDAASLIVTDSRLDDGASNELEAAGVRVVRAHSEASGEGEITATHGARGR